VGTMIDYSKSRYDPGYVYKRNLWFTLDKLEVVSYLYFYMEVERYESWVDDGGFYGKRGV
jgi:hypothetical protein